MWIRVHWQDQAPTLTLYQVRLLLTAVLPVPVLDAARALKMVLYYQHRNHAAFLSHRKRKTQEREALAVREAERRQRYPGRPPKRDAAAASA